MLVQLIITLLYWSVTISIGIITLLIIYTLWEYGTLEKVKGLTGVAKPMFIGGSDPFQYKKVIYDSDMENVKKLNNRKHNSFHE